MKSNVVFRPTVVFGLGGTGTGVVLKLKKRFIDTFGSVPPIIRFMTIDTTESVEFADRAMDGQTVTLEPHEQFILQVMSPQSLVGGANQHIDAWWPSNIPVSAIIAGAGQVRARGRLALFAKIRDVAGRIRNAINEVNTIKKQKQAFAEEFQVSERGGVEIYIVGSLAGGTGSGIFLDVSFLARKNIDALSNITGVMVLPRLFSGLPGTHLVNSNAYGALKEIEFLTKLKPDERFEIDYGTEKAPVDQPPFDLLYLIDSINEDGKVVSDQNDLLNLVADGLYIQIGSQIGTDSSNTVDNIKTQLSTSGHVLGRSTKYCSFGVAAMTLPVREYEIMKNEEARRLVSEGLLNGMFPEEELETEVVSFLEENKLREDETDDLIDSLREREGGGQLRFPMSLGSIKFDKMAPTLIKNLHATHRGRVEQQVAQQIEANYQRLLERSTAAISVWWEKAINQPNGPAYAQRYGEKLAAKLEWYQQMMESESRGQRELLQGLSFKPAEEQIKEAVKAWINVERRIRTACENYKGIADRQSELYIEMVRRDRAAELYSALRSQVTRFLGRCESIVVNLEAALKICERSCLTASSRRGGTSLFEEVVKYDVQAERPEVSAEQFFAWHLRERGSAVTWADRTPEDLVEMVMTYVTEVFQPLFSTPIDDILQRSTSEEVGRNLGRLADLASPLWRYDDGKIPVVNRGTINELFHYGVADAEKTCLRNPKLFTNVPRGASDPSVVSTRDLQRITLFKVKVGVPLFALQEIEEMEHAYKDPDKVVSSHVHRDWESLPDLIPHTGEGQNLRWFAMAQAPEPFALIERQGQWYYIRSRQAKRTDGGLLRLGNGRLKAYQAFEKNQALVKEVSEQLESILRSAGEAEVTKVLTQYVDDLAGQASTGMVDSGVKEQVENEIRAIEEYMQGINRIS